MAKERYDVIIIGGGPAGLSAGLYAARSCLKTLIVESDTLGGLITSTDEIENYPGSPVDSTGYSLTERMIEQSHSAGAVTVNDKIIKIIKNNSVFEVYGETGEYITKAVIIATGSHPRLLGIPGEREFRAKGVSYCATCDGGFFRNKHVVVIGGGDSALKEADYLTRFASKVTVVYRRSNFKTSNIITKNANENIKIEFIFDSVVTSINGDKIVASVSIKNDKTNEITELSCDGVFIFAGYIPNSDIQGINLEKDQENRILTNRCLMTNIEGVFAAGDVRDTELKQVITAAADGALAATEAEKYISKKVANL